MMIQTVQRALVFFPLGLFFAGCGGGHRAEFHSAPAPALLAHTMVPSIAADTSHDIDRSVSRSDAKPAPRHDEQPDETIASGSRYDITLDEVRVHLQNNTAVIIDARQTEDFSRGHVRGAFNLPAGQEETYMKEISQDVAMSQFIIIYCNSSQCPDGDTVYDYVASWGYTNMRVFKPGWQTLALERGLK